MPTTQLFEFLETPNQRLRFFRESFDLSQKEMGAHFGKGQSTYLNWEKDGARIPTHARSILHNLGVNLTWLDVGEGEMLRPGISLEVIVADGSKQLRKTVRSEGISSGGGSTVAESHASYPYANYPSTAEEMKEYVERDILRGGYILPSMVAQAAQMVDAVIEAMPPERRPSNPKRWEAYAIIARYLAQDKAEGKEGAARTFLLGLRAEWLEAPAKTGA